MTNTSFRVSARVNSVSGGIGLDTGIALSPGRLLVIDVDPNQTWSAGEGARTSNANGLGNPFGDQFGLYARGPQSFLFGALVGSLDGGNTFFGVGTRLSMTILTQGTLTLYYWDSNNHDNWGELDVMIRVYDGPRL